MQPRLQAVADQVHNAESGARPNTAKGKTNGSACDSKITGGTACLREAVARHESHHSNVCYQKKGTLIGDLLTGFDYRNDMRLADVAQEEIVGYYLEINYLRGELKAIRERCPFRVDGTYMGLVAYRFIGTICGLDRDFTLQATSDVAFTTGVFTFKAGDKWSYSGRWGPGAGGFPPPVVTASGFYKFEELDDDSPSLIMDGGSNWTLALPDGTPLPMGNGQHFGTGSTAIKLMPHSEVCP